MVTRLEAKTVEVRRLTGVGEAVEELSTVHAIRGLHPRGLNSGGQRYSILTGRYSALTGDQGSRWTLIPGLTD